MNPQNPQPAKGAGVNPVVGGWFHIVVLALGLAFMAWNAKDLYQLLIDPLPSPRSAQVLAGLDTLYSNLITEMERQRSDTQHSPAAASKRVEILLKLLETNLSDLHLSAEGMGDVRPYLGNASQYISMAELASWELRRMTREDNVHGMELEARANVIMAMAEIRAALQSVGAPTWDLVQFERDNRVWHIAINLGFGVLACGLLVYLFLDKRLKDLSAAESTAAYWAANPPPWAVGATAKPRTSDMVINLDDTMVVRTAPETAPGPAAPAPETAPSIQPEPASEAAATNLEGAKMLAGAAARSLHHDLTVINGYSDLLLESLPSDNPVSTDLRAIRRAGERANVLAGQLQAFSDSKPDRWESFDINNWLAEMRPRIEALVPPGVELLYSLGPAAGVVRGDPDRLEQAIKSLVLNATDAMPAGGELSIESAVVEPSPGEFWTSITVRDNGRGIDNASLRHLFDAKTSGIGPRNTGIGLPAVSAILEEHRGHVEVESAPGKGSSFHLMVPKPVAARGRAAGSGARTSR